MLREMLELTQMAEELGFDIVSYSEHHFYTEGMEAGATPTPHLLNLLALPHGATARYGAPGELDDNGRLRRTSPVPKPFQKPHPPLFQALTTTEETIRWAAREAVSHSAKSSASSNCLAQGDAGNLSGERAVTITGQLSKPLRRSTQ